MDVMDPGRMGRLLDHQAGRVLSVFAGGHAGSQVPVGPDPPEERRSRARGRTAGIRPHPRLCRGPGDTNGTGVMVKDISGAVGRMARLAPDVLRTAETP